MSNFKCAECGMINIDCGWGKFKTPREIELETLVIELENRLKTLDEEAVTYQLTEKEYEEYKKLKVSSKQLEKENETLKSLNKHLTENGLFCQRHFKEENERLKEKLKIALDSLNYIAILDNNYFVAKLDAQQALQKIKEVNQ